MISFAPFRKYLKDNGKSLKLLYENKVIKDTKALVKINNDSPQITMYHVNLICEYFNLKVEEVVCYVPDGSVVHEGDETPLEKLRPKRRKYQINDMKEYVKRSGLKQLDLSNELDVTTALVSMWVRGTQPIYEEYIDKLVNLLAIEATDIKEIQ